MVKPLDKPTPTGYDEYLQARIAKDKRYAKRRKGIAKDVRKQN